VGRGIQRPGWRRLVLFIGLAAAAVGLMLAYTLVMRWRSSIRQERQELAALALGQSYLDRGQTRQAIRAVSSVQAGGPHDAEALTIKGAALAALEEIGPARQTLERAWNIRPTADAARVLAAIYLSAYENERGLQMLLEASRLTPSDYRAWFAMGQAVYLRLRRFDLAADAFRQSLKRKPDHTESRIGLAEALLGSHHFEEADTVSKQVLSERPDDPKVLVLAAEISLELGREEDVDSYLRKTLAIDPNRREALILRARQQLHRGRRMEALADAEHACALDPNDHAGLMLLSSIQSSLGLEGKADETLSRSEVIQKRFKLMDEVSKQILKDPHDPEPRWRLGQLAAQAGMKALAIQCYQAALAEAPDFETASRSLLELGFAPSRLPPPATGITPSTPTRQSPPPRPLR
jgi:tetratricopeptide (TPR) repeat protein